MNDVSFKKGLSTQLPATRSDDTLYFVSDKGQLYIGEHNIGENLNDLTVQNIITAKGLSYKDDSSTETSLSEVGITVDPSNVPGGWSKNLISVKSYENDDTEGNPSTIRILGAYGGAHVNGKSKLIYTYMGGTYSDPWLKMDMSTEEFTFKNTPKVGTKTLATTDQISDIVYSPNGTMLSQKLDGDGSFEFVNEVAGIESKQFTEETRVGTYAVTLGGKSAATGKRALAEGTSTWAEGNYSHAEGNKSYAKGAQSHAEGSQAFAEGGSAHAEGWKTMASGEAAHAEGALTKATGEHSHAEGSDTEASGTATHAEGILTKATVMYAHAEGNQTTAKGSAAHTEGYYTTASGDSSHAEGNQTHAKGDAAHAEGFNTEASLGAHAEGYMTKAEGQYTHAEGDNTKALEYASHVEGARTTASGMMAHAEGEHTVASGKNSHAGGLGTRATADNQTVVGKWNAVDNDALFIVGNGVGTFNEWGDSVTSIEGKNAFSVMNSNTPTIKLGNTTITEAQLIKILNFIDSIEG